jgi:hypothetical protein
VPHAWDSDDRLLEDLRDAVTEPGPVPPEYLEAGRAAFAWRTIDADLLLLTSYDSVLDPELASRARSALAARQLVFDADGVSVQVEVTAAGIAGQLVPPAPARVRLLTATGSAEEAEADELGFFVLGAPPPGPVRLRCAGTSTFLTDWFLV